MASLNRGKSSTLNRSMDGHSWKTWMLVFSWLQFAGMLCRVSLLRKNMIRGKPTVEKTDNTMR